MPLPKSLPKCPLSTLPMGIIAVKVVDGKAQSVPVQVTRVNGGQEYIVESGLKVGDTIVAEGVGLLREGTSVQPKTNE